MRAVRIIWMLACLVMVMPLAAASWKAYPTAGVVLHVRPGQERLAQRLRPMLEAEVPRVARALGVTKVRAFDVFAFASRADFLAETGMQPDLLGQSQSWTGEIHLDASGAGGATRRVLAHELAHSLLDQRLEWRVGAIPRWVNEGIAGHLSDPVSPAQLTGISRMIHRDGVLSLTELEEAFPGGPHRDAAYLQSRAMIAWLEDAHPGALREIIAAIAGGATFRSALRAVTGLSIEDWWQRWQQSVPTIIYWLTFLASPAVYSPLALILLWVALRRLLRKEPGAEEAHEDDDEDEDDAEETAEPLENPRNSVE